jgi:hypothetical protein
VEGTTVIDPASLSQTVDAVNLAFFEGRALGAGRRKEVAHWIAARQGLPGAYAGTFAGFPNERERGIVVFTGERITSASARHILGEETCRALHLLRVRDAGVTGVLRRASAGLMRCLERAAQDPRHTNPGLYCCGKCTVGLWRHLLAGGLDRQEERLRRGIAHLRSMRGGEGQWRRFPFWYTVLALSEMEFAEAATELQYAAPALRVAAGRAPAATTYARRRQALATRVLTRM